MAQFHLQATFLVAKGHSAMLLIVLTVKGLSEVFSAWRHSASAVLISSENYSIAVGALVGLYVQLIVLINDRKGGPMTLLLIQWSVWSHVGR
jgi:hypothetical protein